MEANRTRHRWTYAEYAGLPVPSEARGARFEVIAGELFVTPAPGLRHQEVAARLVAHLVVFVDEHRLGTVFTGPVDVLFQDGDYLEPDIAFVRGDRSHLLTDRGIEGPPDLVVEILSPSTAHRDRGIKLERYRHFRVEEYWVIDLERRTVEVWKFAEGATEPRVLEGDDTLAWTPAPARAPLLHIAVGKLLGSS